MNIRARINSIFRAATPPVVLAAVHKFLYSRQILSATRKMGTCSKLHLGCGANIFNGWGNIDLVGNAKVIGWNCTTRFPIKSATIKFIYNEHFLEHITIGQGRDFLEECYRILQSGGVLRISTPNLRKIVDEYLLGWASEWRNIPYSANTGAKYTPCRMVNDAMRLWGHEFVYDYEELTTLLKNIGFSKVSSVAWQESTYEDLKGLESRPFHDDIIVEAVK